ncbi:MAG: hypothetical protein ND866_18350 [Pyrinomonadaceae bacterium]|nr:hypothetical protein [Pyrinomonadaceae bacterium]
MSRKKIPSKQELVDALIRNDGNMASTARAFGCSRALVWQHVDKDPKLRELTDDLNETFIDEAESQLYKHIRDGNVVATIFFLKTKARHRGYSERLELVPLSRTDIQIELGNPNEIENDHTEALNGNGPAIALLEQ